MKPYLRIVKLMKEVPNADSSDLQSWIERVELVRTGRDPVVFSD